MCKNKETFWSRARAEKIAARWGQRVYECPICFCWHCTSKEKWQDEYVGAQEHEVAIRTIRTEYNAILAEKNRRINELELALADAKSNRQGGE